MQVPSANEVAGETSPLLFIFHCTLGSGTYYASHPTHPFEIASLTLQRQKDTQPLRQQVDAPFKSNQPQKCTEVRNGFLILMTFISVQIIPLFLAVHLRINFSAYTPLYLSHASVTHEVSESKYHVASCEKPHAHGNCSVL